MGVRRFLLLGGILAAFGLSQVSAQVIDTGTVSYTPGAPSGNAMCSDNTQDNFTGTVIDTMGPFGGGASLTFSICDNPDTLTDGQFQITNGTDELTGTFGGVDVGYTPVSPVEAIESYSGTFTVTNASGPDVAGENGFSAYFTASDTINPSNPAAGGSGTFSVSTPEPATMALFGLGLAGAALLKRRRERK